MRVVKQAPNVIELFNKPDALVALTFNRAERINGDMLLFFDSPDYAEVRLTPFQNTVASRVVKAAFNNKAGVAKPFEEAKEALDCRLKWPGFFRG